MKSQSLAWEKPDLWYHLIFPQLIFYGKKTQPDSGKAQWKVHSVIESSAVVGISGATADDS